jgi:hypothetical protein
MNASGQYQIAGTGINTSYYSTNYGNTWSSTSQSIGNRFAISANGDYISASGETTGKKNINISVTPYSILSTNLLTIKSSQESGSATTGALTVTGGVGIGGNTYITGNTFIGSNLSVTGNTTISQDLTVSGNTFLNGIVNPMTLVDGSVLLTNTPPLDFSNNFATNWILAPSQPDEQNWNGIAMNASGQYQSAIITGGNIYISTNYGITWTLSPIIPVTKT